MTRKNSGFTLVEVMVAMGVAAVLSLGLMSMISYMSRGNRGVEEQAEITQLSNGIAVLLSSNSQACFNNLTGITAYYTATPTSVQNAHLLFGPPAFHSTAILDGSTPANPVYTVTNPPNSPPYTGNSVTISDWYVVYTGNVTQNPSGPGGLVSAYLELEFTSINSIINKANASLGMQTRTTYVPLEVSTTSVLFNSHPANITLSNVYCSGSSVNNSPWTYPIAGNNGIVALTAGGGQVFINEGDANPPGINAALEVAPTAPANPGIHSKGAVQFDTSATVGVAGTTSGVVTVADGAGGQGGTLTVDAGGNSNGNTAGTAAIYTGGSVYAGTYFYTSDRSLKRDIKKLDGLALIERLQGHRFVWKKTGEPDMGVIAQEVEKIAPEIVKTGTHGIKAVKYDSLIAPLIEAVKTEQKEIVKLRAEVDALKRGRTLSSQGKK